MSGKKYPQCVQALQIGSRKNLLPLLANGSVDLHSKLQQVLQINNNESRMTKLWVNIKPIFLTMQFICA